MRFIFFTTSTWGASCVISWSWLAAAKTLPGMCCNKPSSALLGMQLSLTAWVFDGPGVISGQPTNVVQVPFVP